MLGPLVVAMGIKERGGKMTTEVIPNVKKVTLRKAVNGRVENGSAVSTNELFSYNLLTGDGYQHGRVKHRRKQWTSYDVENDVLHHVNQC